MSRFDYVKYDKQSCDDQANFKEQFENIERHVNSVINPVRYRSLVMTSLEETYCWIGKAIRDDQIDRNETDVQEERSNS